jgi:hypothetical protein
MIRRTVLRSVVLGLKIHFRLRNGEPRWGATGVDKAAHGGEERSMLWRMNEELAPVYIHFGTAMQKGSAAARRIQDL